MDVAVPKLTRDEEFYAISLSDITKDTIGSDAAIVLNGDAVVDPRAAARLLLGVLSNGEVPQQIGSSPIFASTMKVVEGLIGRSIGNGERDQMGVANLRQSFSGLTPKESSNLQQFSSDVGTKVLDKILDRLDALR